MHRSQCTLLSSSPYTSGSGTTVTMMTGWGCAPTPFTETTASTTQSSTLIPINSTTAISSSLATNPNGIPTATRSSPPSSIVTPPPTGKGFTPGEHPSLSVQQQTGHQKLTKPDFSRGGKIGCAIGASIVVALFLWWLYIPPILTLNRTNRYQFHRRWPRRLRCSGKRAAKAETAVTAAGKQSVSGKQAAPATAVQEKPIPVAEIRSRNPDAARKASFAARSI